MMEKVIKGKYFVVLVDVQVKYRLNLSFIRSVFSWEEMFEEQIYNTSHPFDKKLTRTGGTVAGKPGLKAFTCTD